MGRTSGLDLCGFSHWGVAEKWWVIKFSLYSTRHCIFSVILELKAEFDAVTHWRMYHRNSSHFFSNLYLTNRLCLRLFLIWIRHVNWFSPRWSFLSFDLIIEVTSFSCENDEIDICFDRKLSEYGDNTLLMSDDPNNLQVSPDRLNDSTRLFGMCFVPPKCKTLSVNWTWLKLNFVLGAARSTEINTFNYLDNSIPFNGFAHKKNILLCTENAVDIYQTGKSLCSPGDRQLSIKG